MSADTVRPDTIHKVFYIDDSEDEFFLSRLLFRSQRVDIELVCFADFDDFLDDFQSRSPEEVEKAIVVVDMNLTVIKGTEGIERLRQTPMGKGVIVGVCTGSEDPADMRSAFTAGADFFVPKPLDRDCITRICKAVPTLDLITLPDDHVAVNRLH